MIGTVPALSAWIDAAILEGKSTERQSFGFEAGRKNAIQLSCFQFKKTALPWHPDHFEFHPQMPGHKLVEFDFNAWQFLLKMEAPPMIHGLPGVSSVASKRESAMTVDGCIKSRHRAAVNERQNGKNVFLSITEKLADPVCIAASRQERIA